MVNKRGVGLLNSDVSNQVLYLVFLEVKVFIQGVEGIFMYKFL
jgi:hypothetical protein